MAWELIGWVAILPVAESANGHRKIHSLKHTNRHKGTGTYRGLTDSQTNPSNTLTHIHGLRQTDKHSYKVRNSQIH